MSKTFNHPYKDGHELLCTPGLPSILISYTYSKFYKRLELTNGQKITTDNTPEIICPMCMNYKFYITYGAYECIGNCDCGHKMTIYDG